MGVPGSRGILVRQLAARLHVFESFLVACSHTFFCRTFSVVLVSNACVPQPASVDRAGTFRRADGECLLPECGVAAHSSLRRPIELFSTDDALICAARRRRSARIVRNSFGISHYVRNRFHCRNAPDSDHPENYLWRISADPLYGRARMVLDESCSRKRMVFVRPRTVYLDADSSPCVDRPCPVSAD